MVIDGDTWHDVLNTVMQIHHVLTERGPGRNIASGGVNSGYTLVDCEDPEMTHEKYAEQLAAYTAWQKKPL